jgi:hypothetical protein
MKYPTDLFQVKSGYYQPSKTRPSIKGYWVISKCGKIKRFGTTKLQAVTRALVDSLL